MFFWFGVKVSQQCYFIPFGCMKWNINKSSESKFKYQLGSYVSYNKTIESNILSKMKSRKKT